MSQFSKVVKKLEVPHNDEELPPKFLVSHDVKPIERGRRTWADLTSRMASVHVALGAVAFKMSNFQVGRSMLAIGLNWWQTFLATMVGHFLAATLVVFSSHPGLFYNISFPIARRIAWGFYGSIFVVINRILLSAIWFGVQSWQGGLVTYICLRALWPSIDHIHNTIPASTGMTLPQFIGFILFYIIQLPLLMLGPHRLRYLVYIASSLGFIVQLVLVIWACATMTSFGSVLDSKSKLGGGNLGWPFIYGVTVTMSSITSGTVSVCDYARFAKKPTSGTWSQLGGWVPCWLSNVFGVLTIAATQQRYGDQLWSIASLLIAIQDANPTPGTRAVVWFAAATFLLSQLSLNIVGNSFSGGTDMSALIPKYINIRRGQYITAILGVVINPWNLLSGAVIFISVMSAYTIFLQPFLGILLAYYFVLNWSTIKVADLYTTGSQSIYWYNCGVNWRAVVAWIVGVAPHLPGFLHVVTPSIVVGAGASKLYFLCSITSFLFAFVVTIVLGYAFPVASQKEFVARTTKPEARNLCEEFIGDLIIAPVSEEKYEDSQFDKGRSYEKRGFETKA
ncbi:allantoin permease [Halenospora varia]|nr:allantoin permease [Halenospora varia]